MVSNHKPSSWSITSFRDCWPCMCLCGQVSIYTCEWLMTTEPINVDGSSTPPRCDSPGCPGTVGCRTASHCPRFHGDAHAPPAAWSIMTANSWPAESPRRWASFHRRQHHLLLTIATARPISLHLFSPRNRGSMFLPALVCLSVCLSVCVRVCMWPW